MKHLSEKVTDYNKMKEMVRKFENEKKQMKQELLEIQKKYDEL